MKRCDAQVLRLGAVPTDAPSSADQGVESLLRSCEIPLHISLAGGMSTSASMVGSSMLNINSLTRGASPSHHDQQHLHSSGASMSMLTAHDHHSISSSALQSLNPGSSSTMALAAGATLGGVPSSGRVSSMGRSPSAAGGVGAGGFGSMVLDEGTDDEQSRKSPTDYLRSPGAPGALRRLQTKSTFTYRLKATGRHTVTASSCLCWTRLLRIPTVFRSTRRLPAW